MASIGTWKLPRKKSSGPPYFTRTQIVNTLHQVGVLLTLKGANPFRTRAYANASRLLSGLTVDLWELIISGELYELKGIGKGIGSAIEDTITNGVWPDDWVEIFEETPAGLIEMLGIPNLGPKRIKQMNDELGVQTVDGLLAVCEQGLVAPLDGFGEKSQQKIIDGIDLMRRFNARRRLNIGLIYGEALEHQISSLKGVIQAQLAGSARRRLETIGDLDIVVAINPQDLANVKTQILDLPGIADVKGAGESKISLILESSIFSDGISISSMDDGVLEAIGGGEYKQLESSGTIDAQVRLVTPEVFPFTLAYFTGSKDHNVRMRQRSLDLGYKLNEFGLIPLDKAGDLKGMEAAQYSIKVDDESGIYEALGLAYVPPELREDTGEIESAKDSYGSDIWPELLSHDDLRGAFHNHTTSSDGEATLDEMIQAAINLNWDYLGISDHSQTLKVANGLSPDDLIAQNKLIQNKNASFNEQDIDFRIFHGVESDIIGDGRLDYDDNILSQLDYVVASVHAVQKWKARDESTNTEEMIRAIEHPACKILGHPTGRILQGREGYEVDMHTVLRSMAELNQSGNFKAVELNASPYRLDLDWRLCKYAKELGVPVSINPDAHDIRGLRDVYYGVEIARKGWLSRGDVLNTRGVEDIIESFQCD